MIKVKLEYGTRESILIAFFILTIFFVSMTTIWLCVLAKSLWPLVALCGAGSAICGYILHLDTQGQEAADK